MKKKKVKMIVSAVCLVVLLIAYVGIKSFVAEQELKEAEENLQETEMVFSASVDEMNKVTLSGEETDFTFVKEGDLWFYEEDREFPVDQDTVTNAFGSLTSIEADFIIENPADLSEYELEEPNASIVVSTEEGDTVLWMGMSNESAGQCYIRKGDDTQKVYVVSSTLMDSLEKSLYDYAEMGAFPDIVTDTVTNLKVSGKNVDYTLKKEQAVWMVSPENEKEEKADSAVAASLVSSLANIEYASFVNYHSEDDAAYGLDQPYAVIEIDYQEEITLEATPSEGEEILTEATVAEGEPSDVSETSEEETILEDRKMILWIGDEAEADTRYVKIAGSNQIYTINQDLLDIFLAKSVEELLDMTVSYLYIENLSELSVEIDGETYSINVSRETLENENGEEETTITYLLGKEEIDSIAFETFYNKVTNMTAQSRVKETISSEEAEISLVLTDLQGKETKVSYYEYDSSFYAAVTEEKVYLVNKMNVKDMIESFSVLIGADE